MEKDIVTILYEVRDQLYIIGVTNEDSPKVAVMGVNTTRPLPQNMKTAMIEAVKELKNLKEDPKIIDYNAPSQYLSKVIIDSTLATQSDRPVKTVGEVIEVLKTKMNKAGK